VVAREQGEFMRRIVLCILVAMFSFKAFCCVKDGPQCRPICRVVDPNGDGVLDPADVFYLLNYIYSGGPEPIGDGDVNGDGVVTIEDVDYLIDYLYSGGPRPPCFN
jgi:hypothetical protein